MTTQNTKASEAKSFAHLSVTKGRFFPDEPQERISLLDVQTHGFFNLASAILVCWTLMQIYVDYRQTGYPIDLTLFWELLDGFHWVMVLTISMCMFTTFTSILLQYHIQSNLKHELYVTILYWISQVILFVSVIFGTLSFPMSICKDVLSF